MTVFKMIFIYSLIHNTFAFNWSKCSRQDLGALYFLGMTTSTLQFMTSTGGCAMIGEKSHDEKVFFVHNFEEIKIDVARGGGEYLAAFNSYSNCQGKNSQLQSSYENIFVADLESSFNNLKKFSCKN